METDPSDWSDTKATMTVCCNPAQDSIQSAAEDTRNHQSKHTKTTPTAATWSLQPRRSNSTSPARRAAVRRCVRQDEGPEMEPPTPAPHSAAAGSLSRSSSSGSSCSSSSSCSSTSSTTSPCTGAGGGAGAREEEDEDEQDDTMQACAQATAPHTKVEQAVSAEEEEEEDGDFVDDMYKHSRRVECEFQASPHYMDSQPDVTAHMREILVDWIIQLHAEFHFHDTTLHLIVNIIDRYLAVATVERERLQLVGCAAILLAAKLEEPCTPTVADLVFLTQNAYTAAQVLATEAAIVQALGFRFNAPTTVVFLGRFLQLAGLTDGHSRALAFYMAERMLQDYSMLAYRPSAIAAAATLLALHMSTRHRRRRGDLTAKPARLLWTPSLQAKIGYTTLQLEGCVRAMHAILVAAPKAACRATFVKYSQPCLGRVASVPLPPLA